MRYRWIEEQKTCEELAAELGCEILSIARGQIIIGYQDGIIPDGKGGEIQVPITRPGIEIEFAREPEPEQLEKLDMMFPELRRAGGKTMADELRSVRDRVYDLEKERADAEKP